MKRPTTDYDETVLRHVRGEASPLDVWRADPYDRALGRMADNAQRRDAALKATESDTTKKADGSR